MFIATHAILRRTRRRIEAETRALMGDQAGNILVEFAFIITVLILLGVGMFDFGRYGLLFTRSYSAARAGAQFGIQSQGTASNYAGMRQAALDDAGLTAAELQVDPRRYCSCPGSTAEVGCAGTCADGGYVPNFVEVTVSNSLDLFFDYPGIGDTLPVVTRIRMRVN